MKKIIISKLDAVRRQLFTAIRLYFNHGDIVSMHTLAAAAFKITQNICDINQDLSDSLSDWVKTIIKPEYEKLFWQKFHETTNFFKHAERDPDSVHEYYPKQTEMLLFVATHQYQQLTREWSPEIRLFLIWYATHNPKICNMPQETISLGLDMYSNDRNKFWRELMPVLQQQIDQGFIT